MSPATRKTLKEMNSAFAWGVYALMFFCIGIGGAGLSLWQQYGPVVTITFR